MTKPLLCKQLRTKYPYLTNDQVKLVIDLFFEQISHSLEKKERIELRGLGIFSTKLRVGRKARNPSTNKEIMVKDKNKIAFRMGKELFDKLNNL